MKFLQLFLRVSLFVTTFVAGFVMTIVVRVVLSFMASDPIPVALEAAAVDSSKQESITMDLQWGGFYATKEGNEYRIFRLLDINRHFYHVMTYSETFPELPRVNDVTFLIPEDDHVSYQGVGILAKRPILIGRKALKPDDLQGYRWALKKTGMHDFEIIRLLEKMIDSSRESPLETKLLAQNGLLTFDQAGF